MSPIVHPRLARVVAQGSLALAIATSVGGNVLAAGDTVVDRCIAALPPVVLLLTIELISWVPASRPAMAWSRRLAALLISCVAAWVSYWHMEEVCARHGESVSSAHLIPLLADGLIVVASVCLVELDEAARSRTASSAGPRVAPAPEDQYDDTEARSAFCDWRGITAEVADLPHVPAFEPWVTAPSTAPTVAPPARGPVLEVAPDIDEDDEEEVPDPLPDELIEAGKTVAATLTVPLSRRSLTKGLRDQRPDLKFGTARAQALLDHLRREARPA